MWKVDPAKNMGFSSFWQWTPIILYLWKTAKHIIQREAQTDKHPDNLPQNKFADTSSCNKEDSG
jgi:hypothetical protein